VRSGLAPIVAPEAVADDAARRLLAAMRLRGLRSRSADPFQELGVGSRSAMKGDRVTADENRLNSVAGELRQQFSEVGG
jgi:hypothetical protein